MHPCSLFLLYTKDVKNLYIVCGMKCEFPELKGDVIGVDRGAYYLSIKGIRMKAALGDFDSINKKERELIDQYAEEIIAYNPIKDETDLEAAVSYGKRKGYEKVIVYGALGGRQDHNYVNIRLLSLCGLEMELRDEKHILKVYRKGQYEIRKKGFKYLSLFALKDSRISIGGVYYPLDDVILKTTDIYAISNEILAEKADLIIADGEVLVIQAND